VEYSKFENQYILMLAVRAKQDLEIELEKSRGYLDPNTESYIETLKNMINIAKHNMNEME
jgi:hypothetical protein